MKQKSLQFGFRHWVTELWYQNQREREAWGDKGGCEDASEYFRKYKYWLKREYQHRKANNLL